MGRRLPIEVVNQIKLRLDFDEKVTHIATALKVSRDVVYKLQLNPDPWGQLYAPPSVKLGRLGSLLEYQKLAWGLGMVLRYYWTNVSQRLLEFLKGKPTAYIDEMQDFLFNEFDIQTSPFTIHRTF